MLTLPSPLCKETAHPLALESKSAQLMQDTAFSDL